MDVEKLIVLIEKEPHLYNPKLNSYSDKQLRENTWNKIGMEMEQTGMYFLYQILNKSNIK
jgi:hypothetical protein